MKFSRRILLLRARKRSGRLRRYTRVCVLFSRKLLDWILCVDIADDIYPNELSFKKGEVLLILDKFGNWWQAQTQDGKTGGPYSYLSFLSIIYLWTIGSSRPIKLFSTHRIWSWWSSLAESCCWEPESAVDGWGVIPVYVCCSPRKLLVWILCVDTAAATDELSFRKGEVLLIFDKSVEWWQAQRGNGRAGSPYSYLPFLSIICLWTIGCSCPLQFFTTHRMRKMLIRATISFSHWRFTILPCWLHVTFTLDLAFLFPLPHFFFLNLDWIY